MKARAGRQAADPPVIAGSVYLVTHKASGKRYVGIAKDVAARFRVHRRQAAAPRPRYLLHRAVQRYGWNAFTIEIIAHASTWRGLCEKERQFIAEYRTFGPGGYNMTAGGEGQLGTIVSEENRAKIAAKLRGRKRDPVAVEKGCAARRGIPQSAETRARIAASHIGISQTAEIRAQISKTLTGRPLSQNHPMRARGVRKDTAETKEKKRLSASRLPRSPEVKAKISASKMGHAVSSEARAKLAAANLGKRASPETLAKLRGRRGTGGKQCFVCAHPEMGEIDALLLLRSDTASGIARRFGVSRDSVQRHKVVHLGIDRAPRVPSERPLPAEGRPAPDLDLAAAKALAVALAGCADSGVHEKNGIKGVRYGSPLRQHYVCGNEEC